MPYELATAVGRLIRQLTLRRQPTGRKFPPQSLPHPQTPPATRRQWLLFTAAKTLGGALLSGCGTWSAPASRQSNPWDLKNPQMSPDAVVLEVAILRIDADSARGPSKSESNTTENSEAASTSPPQSLENIWGEVDEQLLARPLSLQLAKNGFRCGLIDGRPGPALQAALDAHASRHAAATEEGNSGPPTSIQRLHNRAGRRGKVLTGEVRESLDVLLPEGGRLHGKTYKQAQSLISVRSFPRGDGQVDLELTPELEFGEARPKWLGEAAEGSFRIDTSRDRRDFESLRILARLAPGQMLVFGPSLPCKGLGRQFFAETASGTLQPRVMIVRLAQTQLDDLFAPETQRKPLLSTPD